MRLIALLLVLPLALSVSLQDLGVNGVVQNVCSRWIIPFSFEGNCVPVLVVHLRSGELNIPELNTHIDEPGSYRFLLAREGKVTLALCPRDGEGALDPKSGVFCEDMPVLTVTCEKVPVFRTGINGYTCTVCNKGSRSVEANVVIYSPPFAAPLQPLRPIHVNAGACVRVDASILASRPYHLVNMPPTCVEYVDVFGPARACTPTYPTRAEEAPFFKCLVSPHFAIISNLLPLKFELNGIVFEPFEVKRIEKNVVWGTSSCNELKEIQKWGEFKERSADLSLFLGLILVGITGIWARGAKS